MRKPPLPKLAVEDAANEGSLRGNSSNKATGPPKDILSLLRIGGKNKGGHLGLPTPKGTPTPRSSFFSPSAASARSWVGGWGTESTASSSNPNAPSASVLEEGSAGEGKEAVVDEEEDEDKTQFPQTMPAPYMAAADDVVRVSLFL